MKNIILIAFIVISFLAAYAVTGCANKNPSGPAANTVTPTVTKTITRTGTVTATATPVLSATVTATRTKTVTPSRTSTITVTGTVTATATVTVTPLETAGSTIASADFPFSAPSELANWNTYAGNVTAALHNMVTYYDPPGSARYIWDGSVGMTWGSMIYTPAAPINMSTGIFSFYLKCPAQMAGYFITPEYFSGASSDSANVGIVDGSGGWQHLTFNMAGWSPGNGVNKAQITQIRIYVQDYYNHPVSSGFIYLDSVDLNY
jgi:hypothetical protein